VDLGLEANLTLERLAAIRGRYEPTGPYNSEVAKAFQGELNSLAEFAYEHYQANKRIVEEINHLLDVMELDLFLDHSLTTRVSITCIAHQPSYDQGRFDVKESKAPQRKHYFRAFPRLYLGRRVYVRPY